MSDNLESIIHDGNFPLFSFTKIYDQRKSIINMELPLFLREIGVMLPLHTKNCILDNIKLLFNYFIWRYK